MRSGLPNIARELGADERTLRRAASRGTLRCHRPRPRQLELAKGEREYLEGHWSLLHSLLRALRTEPNVSLAVLYGSMARGDDGPGSDVDLLVAFREPRVAAGTDLAKRVERQLGIHVDVARLDRVRATSPQLLDHALNDGRLLVDRQGLWQNLTAERPRVQAAAQRARSHAQQEAAESWAMLVESEA